MLVANVEAKKKLEAAAANAAKAHNQMIIDQEKADMLQLKLRDAQTAVANAIADESGPKESYEASHDAYEKTKKEASDAMLVVARTKSAMDEAQVRFSEEK